MRKLFFLVPLFFCIVACDLSSAKEDFRVLTWNMYLMYDGTDDGIEFEPFTGNNSEVFDLRIRRAVSLLAGIDADVMVFEEIENGKVLERMIDEGLGKKGFRYYGATESSGSLEVGFISKRKPLAVRIHSSDSPRPFMEAVFGVGEDKVSVFMLHAKSRIGGGERERAALFEHIEKTAREREHPVIIAGDFNEDPRTGPSIRDEKYAGAVMKVTGEHDRVRKGVLFAPILFDSLLTAYSYNNMWYSYDNMLSNEYLFDGWALEWKECIVIDDPLLFSPEGYPERYEKETGDGFSDHLPLLTLLEYN